MAYMGGGSFFLRGDVLWEGRENRNVIRLMIHTNVYIYAAMEQKRQFSKIIRCYLAEFIQICIDC